MRINVRIEYSLNHQRGEELNANSNKLVWELDERFLSMAISQAKEIGSVTLDIFDTALTRLLDSPIDLFAVVENELTKRIGKGAKGFARKREEAESEARRRAWQASGAEEIDFDAIYAVLSERMPAIAQHRHLLKETELEVECAHLVAVPDVLELTRRLNDLSIPYAFVSDMYLYSDFLGRMLERAGYQGWRHLVVSSETGKTKASGRQWKKVLQLGDAFQRVLHIGDDVHADVEIPRHHGIATLVYERARSERRVGAQLTPALVPFSRMQREAVLREKADVSELKSEQDFWFGLGQVLGGIVLASYVQWLEKRVNTHKIDRLYFCARDGGLILRAWEAAKMPQKTSIPSRYFYIARRPLNLASGYLESTPDRLSPALLDFLTSIWPNALRLEVILQRSGLGGHEPLEKDLIAAFGPMSTPLSHVHVPQLREVLSKHSAFIHTRLEIEFKNLRCYLQQEEFTANARIGMVDMGWHATMQRSLRQIAQHNDASMSLVGFYYGLWPAAQSNRFGAGVIESAFSSEFMKLEEQPEMAEAVAYLEELHSARHGTVLGYRQTNNRWEAVCADSPKEVEQFDRATQHFQAGAIETVTKLFNGSPVLGGITLEDLGADAVRAALGAIFLSPSKEELKFLGGIGHCATFDHSHVNPLISVDASASLEQLRHQISTSEWKTGCARMALSGAPEAIRVQVRSVIQEVLSSRGDKYFRQFV